jgi:HKD family nuclease
MAAKFLVSNLEETVRQALLHLSQGADEVQLAVAYVSDADLIEAWLKKAITVKLVVALQPPTNPAVLRTLVNSHPIQLKAKFRDAQFHSTLFLFLKKKMPLVAQVGSSNLTGGGLNWNLETNVIIRDPEQLRVLAEHFKEILRNSADLQPGDIDKYEAHCKQTAEDRARVRKLQDEYDHQIVVPRMPKGGKRRRPVKEASRYLAFWKSVDRVIKLVKPVSDKEWPGLPVYLTIDHFWHWLVKVWDRKGAEVIKANPEVRSKRLPELFAEYARWDKQGENYTATDLKNNSDFIRTVLSTKNLPQLTEKAAAEVYSKLHSGGMRTRRFGSDAAFVKLNRLDKIKGAFDYLLWSDADVQDRISALLSGGPHNLRQFGASCVQELLGWVNPTKMPLRNEKADNALELIIGTKPRSAT